MAKFTVYFKDKAIQSQIFDSGVIHIGSDNSNEIHIDNLAVAPVHAVVIIKKNNTIIKQLNVEYPLLINNEPYKEKLLENNDQISIGKHVIIFNSAESVQTPVKVNSNSERDINLLNQKLMDQLKSKEANLQVLEGSHIGRVLPLKKSMTRLGHPGTGIVVISRRKNGYYISSLDGSTNIIINNETLGDKTIALKHNDIIVIDNISMQFFLEN